MSEEQSVDCGSCPNITDGCRGICEKVDLGVPRWSANWHMQEFYRSAYGLHVRAEDYAVALSQLAALREELAKKEHLRNAATGYSARLNIILKLAASLLDDPEYEFCGIDFDYEDKIHDGIKDLQQRLADAERRNALPVDWADQLFAEMERRFELSKQYHQDHLVNDDTQIGVEFAIEWISAALNKPEEAKS